MWRTAFIYVWVTGKMNSVRELEAAWLCLAQTTQPLPLAFQDMLILRTELCDVQDWEFAEQELLIRLCGVLKPFPPGFNFSHLCGHVEVT